MPASATWASIDGALGRSAAGSMRELQETLQLRVVTHEYPVLHPAAPQYPEAEGRGFLLDVAYPAPPPAVPGRQSS